MKDEGMSGYIMRIHNEDTYYVPVKLVVAMVEKMVEMMDAK